MSSLFGPIETSVLGARDQVLGITKGKKGKRIKHHSPFGSGDAVRKQKEGRSQGLGGGGPPAAAAVTARQPGARWGRHRADPTPSDDSRVGSFPCHF